MDEEHQKRVERYQASQLGTKCPRHVVLADTLFTRWGEPLKAGDDVQWTEDDQIKSGTLLNFCLRYFPDNYSVKVVAAVRETSGRCDVLSGATFEKLLGGKNEADYLLKYLTWIHAGKKRDRKKDPDGVKNVGPSKIKD